MTVDRKRLRELARRMRIWWKPGAQQLIDAGHSVDADIDACADGIDALLDALDAAEQRALPMDDARDAARYRFAVEIGLLDADELDDRATAVGVILDAAIAERTKEHG